MYLTQVKILLLYPDTGKKGEVYEKIVQEFKSLCHRSSCAVVNRKFRMF